MSGGASLEGKVALVTGAGSGLGRAIALRLAADGATVACLDRSADAADAATSAIGEQGGAALALVADVTSSAELAAAGAALIHRLGRLDVCVANAGIVTSGSAIEASDEHWEQTLAVNLTGVWRTARMALPHLVDAGGGSLITMASVGGVVGVAGLAAYAASKGGVIALTRQMAVDYAPRGVRVNAIAPSTVTTPLVEQRMADIAAGPDGSSASVATAALHPLGRLGVPEDVAGAVSFLAGEDSSWITGTVLVVDGGRTAV